MLQCAPEMGQRAYTCHSVIIETRLLPTQPEAINTIEYVFSYVRGSGHIRSTDHISLRLHYEQMKRRKRSIQIIKFHGTCLASAYQMG